MDENGVNESLRIDMTSDTDVAYWCRVLALSAHQLRFAVQHAGPQVQEVQRYLREKGLPAE